jgi:putative flippase GtrA
MISTFLRRPFIRFLLVGGFAALVNILARMAFSLVTPFELAVALAFPVALTVAFVLNRVYVFSAQDGPMGRQYLRFTLVNIAALVPVWLISVGLARWLFPRIAFTWHAETVAHVIGVLSPVAASYVGHKAFTFARG